MPKVENLSVDYGYIIALTNISFHAEKGEIIILVGSNGAGKATALGTISGLVPKAGGNIFSKGQDITRMAPDKVVKVGMCHVPEGRKIFPVLIVYENLIASSLGNPKPSKARIGELVEEQYALFPRPKERIGQVGGGLSGGEQQMLAISRGLMMDPDIVMLDKPSPGFTSIIAEDIFELIMKIRDMGKTIPLIEQNVSVALSIADRGHVPEAGKIIMEGKGKELLVDPKVKAVYLGA